MVGIYKIENLINHKCYIGQSINIQTRWKKEKSVAFDKTAKEYEYPISRAFRKYGIENFSFEIIEECDRCKLNERERYWINFYNSFFSGYNQTLGGDSSGPNTNKEKIIGIFNDLKTTNLYHKEIAKRWDISQEMVQGINTGRYWYVDSEDYPLQKSHKKYSNWGIEKKIWHCQKCNKEISKGASYCKDCWDIENRKIKNRPNREELKLLIRTKPFLQIAKQFNVSDTTIRKWCKRENLPSTVKKIKTFSDEEWLKI